MTAAANFPPAFLALWNDIEPSRIDEYERWHTLEHVPERVWAPGFMSGARYVATRAGQPRYFTLYELEDLSALDTPAYRDLVEHPTPWSASMRPALSNFLRKPCRRVAAAGATRGAALVVVRVVFPTAMADQALAAITHRLLIDGARDIVTSASAGRVANAGPQAMQNRDDAPSGDEWIVLIEATDIKRLAAIEQLALTVVHDVGTDTNQSHAIWCAASRYRYVSQIRHGDVAQSRRPAARTDLMPAGQHAPRPGRLG